MGKRINKDVGYLSLGLILLLVAASWFVYNICEDTNAGKKSQIILNQMENSEAEESVFNIGGEEFCGRIVIDSLGIELPVYDNWNYAHLKTAPCRYSGSVDTDDIIIAGHNYKSHFGRLDNLKIDDEVIFLDAKGITHTFVVKEIAQLDGTAVTDMKSGEWDFTLFTCNKSGMQRITLRCHRKE